ncbi:hypothetical protein WDW86_03055 [Bdellovibrionota bacterium FG-2]
MRGNGRTSNPSEVQSPMTVANQERTLTEVAQCCQPSGKVGVADGGYFQLAHSVFRDRKLRDLSGDSFRLYLWLSSQGWRFPDSDGTVRASIGFITEALGMPHATVSRALKILRETKLIQLVQTDFKRGNLWRITAQAVWSPPDGKVPQGKPPRNEAPPPSPPPPSNRGGSHLSLSRKPPQIEVEIR